MKTILAVLTSVAILSVPLAVCHGAEVAAEGSGVYKSGLTATFRTLAMEKERLEMQFEIIGAVTDSPEEGPLFNATKYGLGELHAVKGEYTERGFIRYTRPDGDMIFMTYEANGRLGTSGRTITGTFVGGTGRCAGITGGMVLQAVAGLKPPNEGALASVSVGTYNWKLP